MFHPLGHPLERGWVGRVEGDRVVQLAAQTLQAFFTGGGTAREHAEYRLAEVRFLAPVLHPPSVRVFEDQASFAFGNPASVVGPDAVVRSPDPGGTPVGVTWTRLVGVQVANDSLWKNASGWGYDAGASSVEKCIRSRLRTRRPGSGTGR